MLSLLVFLCPPLAVVLTASSSHAVKNVGYTLLFYVPGVLHARRCVERHTVQRRYDTLMQLLDDRKTKTAVEPATPRPQARRRAAGFRAA